MFEFLGDLTFMLEVLVFGVGLVILHFNKKEPSNYLKWAGNTLTIVALLGMLCTGYFYMRFLFFGGANHPYHMGLGYGPSMMGEMPPGMGMGKRALPNHMMMTPQMMGNINDHMKAEMGPCLDQVHGKMMDENAKSQVENCMHSRFFNK